MAEADAFSGDVRPSGAGRLPDERDIALIYAGPLEDRPWQGYLERLREIWDCDYAALTLQDAHLGVPSLFLSERRAPDAAAKERVTQAHRRLAHLDPLGNALMSRGGILTLSDVASLDELVGDPFFEEVIRPRGIARQIGMLIAEPDGFRAHLGLMNGADRPDFGGAERAYFAAVKPHMERALALFSRIQRSEHNKRVFDEALGRLNIAIFLIDAAERVVDLNAAARAICETGEVVLTRGRLSLSGDRDARRLSEALHEAEVRSRTYPGDSHAAIFRTEDGDQPLDILVRTLPQPVQARSEATAKIAVYVSAGSIDFAPSQHFVAELLRLTPTEARLTLLLAEGLTLREAAARIGVTENTIRSYSKQIFEKTGVRRQAELVRLILKSVVLLA